MNIKEHLSQRYSKETILEIVEYVGEHKDRFNEVLQVFLYGNDRERQMAAWVVYHFTKPQQAMSHAYYDQILEGLTEDAHDAIWRASMRLFHFAGIPEPYEGRIVSLAFDVLADPRHAVAVKMFSMCILADYCQKEPDLADELRILIEEQWEHASAGFKSRGRKVLKQLANLKSNS